MDGSITQFIHQLEAGDHSAARPLWERYFPRMVSIAEKELRHRGMSRSGAEDAAQNAIINFWRGAERGQFAGNLNRNRLWRLLALITERKVNRQLERELAQKRGGGRVKTAIDVTGPGSSEFRLEDMLETIPAQEFDLICEEHLLKLDEQLRGVALLKLAGNRNREIADCLSCCERTVERSLSVIRMKWEKESPE